MRVFVLALPVVLLMTGCNNAGPAAGGPAPSQTTAADQPIIGTPAPGSRFARVRIGMGKKEIQDLIGDPTDQNAHMTGKVFIPFYFGGGTTEIDAHYKGEGILTYASRSVGDTSYELIQIKVDPTEGGYVH